MKRLFYVLIFVLLFTSTMPSRARAMDPIRVLVDYDFVDFNTPPLVVNSNTLVEFRPIFEKLGFAVTWNPTTGTVTGEKKGIKIELQVGSKVAKVNGQNKEMLVAPNIINNHTVIPIRFVAENSGTEVVWQPENRFVQIYTINGQLYNAVIGAIVAYSDGDATTYNDSIQVVKKKLAQGADPNYIDYNGQTLLYNTASIGSPELLDILIKSGADINMRSKTGEFKDLPNTPILEAIMFLKYDNVEVLLKYKPDLLNNTENGESVMDFIKDMGPYPNPEAVKELNRIETLLDNYIQIEKSGSSL